jgi:hypothetical protein
MKRYKDGKRHLDQSPHAASHEAIIAGMRPWSEGYGFREMGPNLVRWTQEVGQDVARLVQAAAPEYSFPPPPLHHTVATNPADSTGTGGSAIQDSTPATEASHHHAYAYTNTVVMASHNGSHGTKSHNEGSVELSPEGINLLYSKVFQTLHKSLFLLSQWKLSWDAVNSASPAANESTTGNNLSVDSSALLLHDAVASAAAVAAMTGIATGSGPPPPHHHSPPMPPSYSAATTANATTPTTTTSVMANDWPDTLASLLLAADQSNDHYAATSASSETHHDNDRVVDWQFQNTARHDGEDDVDDGSDDVGAFDDV